jgi:hypothetical protein
LCQATSRRKKKQKQKSKRFAFAKFHLFVPSNYFIEKKAKRFSFSEFYPFVRSNFQEEKKKVKDLHLQNSTPFFKEKKFLTCEGVHRGV